MSVLSKFLPRYAARTALLRTMGDVWMLDDPARLTSLVDQLRAGAQTFTNTDQIRAAMQLGDEAQAEAEAAPYQVDQDGTATFELKGMLLKDVPCLFTLFGIEATSTEIVRKGIAKALADESVSRIRLEVDSPGGTTSGLTALADAVYSARGKKPITAHAQDLACSAAYWVASQADRVTAGQMATIGSIGVYTVIEDLSRAAENAGAKVHLVTSGPYKGGGEPGTVVTEKHLEGFQARIDAMASVFVDTIVRGRGMARADVEKLATGMCWVGAQAVAVGLVDEITGPAAPETQDPEEREATPAEEEQREMSTNNTSAAGPAGELERIRAELAAEKQAREKAEAEVMVAKAKQEAQAAALAEVTKSRKAAVIDAGVSAGRIVGDTRAAVEKYAAVASVEELESFVAGLPVQVRPTAQGKTEKQTEQAAGEIDPKIAKLFGLTKEEAKLAPQIESFSLDGTVRLKDGQVHKLAKEV